MVPINISSFPKVTFFFLFTSASTISRCAVAHLHMLLNALYAQWEKASRL